MWQVLASGLTARVGLPRSDERIHLQAAAQASDPESIQVQENILLTGSRSTCQQEIMTGKGATWLAEARDIKMNDQI